MVSQPCGLGEARSRENLSLSLSDTTLHGTGTGLHLHRLGWLISGIDRGFHMPYMDGRGSLSLSLACSCLGIESREGGKGGRDSVGALGQRLNRWDSFGSPQQSLEAESRTSMTNYGFTPFLFKDSTLENNIRNALESRFGWFRTCQGHTQHGMQHGSTQDPTCDVLDWI